MPQKELEGLRQSLDLAMSPEDFHFCREYFKEGFISREVYRVVIVEPRDETGFSKSEIEKKAKKRTLISLQKYLMTKEGTINQNVNAALLNLIEESGTLQDSPEKQETRDVYLFEIKKDNLKRYVDDLVYKR